MQNERYIGDFVVESGRLVLSDPCYEIGTWYQAVIDDVEPGMWEAYIEKADGQIAALYAKHKDLDQETILLETEILGLGVDSGQFGFFDKAYYRNKTVFGKQPYYTQDRIVDDSWYGHCCDIVRTQQAGVIPHGCVASSGYGDGVYHATLYRNPEGNFVGVRVVFIDEKEEKGE